MEASTGGHMPIIALTANAMKEDRGICLRAGMDGYASKPLRANELFSAIDEVFCAGGQWEGCPVLTPKGHG